MREVKKKERIDTKNPIQRLMEFVKYKSKERGKNSNTTFHQNISKDAPLAIDIVKRGLSSTQGINVFRIKNKLNLKKMRSGIRGPWILNQKERARVSKSLKIDPLETKIQNFKLPKKNSISKKNKEKNFMTEILKDDGKSKNLKKKLLTKSMKMKSASLKKFKKKIFEKKKKKIDKNNKLNNFLKSNPIKKPPPFKPKATKRSKKGTRIMKRVNFRRSKDNFKKTGNFKFNAEKIVKLIEMKKKQALLWKKENRRKSQIIRSNTEEDDEILKDNKIHPKTKKHLLRKSATFKKNFITERSTEKSRIGVEIEFKGGKKRLKIMKISKCRTLSQGSWELKQNHEIWKNLSSQCVNETSDEFKKKFNFLKKKNFSLKGKNYQSGTEFYKRSKTQEAEEWSEKRRKSKKNFSYEKLGLKKNSKRKRRKVRARRNDRYLSAWKVGEEQDLIEIRFE